MAPIMRSVGRGGANRYEDVCIVQGALNRFANGAGGPNPRLDTDGRVGSKTIDAIVEFQQLIVRWANPDGRVDPPKPNGHLWPTLRALAAGPNVAPAGNTVAQELTQPGAPPLTEPDLQGMGLPAAHDESSLAFWVRKIVLLANQAYSTGALVNFWPGWVYLGYKVGGAAGAGVAAGATQLAALAVALYELGQANAIGQRRAQRNLWRWGFAATITALADGRGEWRPTLAPPLR